VTVLRGELLKLRSQLRVRVAVLVCLLGPPALAVFLAAQSGAPKDTLFGRHIHDSGLALPLVVLGFAGTWALPLLTSVVAGDIFANEDAQGTWSALLTRSRSRSDIFLGKALASALAALGLLGITAVSSVVAGLALAGDRPLLGLSGTLMSGRHALLLVLLSWAAVIPPLLAFTSLSWLLSVATRNPLAGVGGPVLLGLLLQLLSLVGGLGRASNAFLTTPFFAWRGLLRVDPYYGPLWQGALVSLVWAVPCALLARRLLLSRDIT
jgi:ABC-2 type transport system permease protein